MTTRKKTGKGRRKTGKGIPRNKQSITLPLFFDDDYLIYRGIFDAYGLHNRRVSIYIDDLVWLWRLPCHLPKSIWITASRKPSAESWLFAPGLLYSHCDDQLGAVLAIDHGKLFVEATPVEYETWETLRHLWLGGFKYLHLQYEVENDK